MKLSTGWLNIGLNRMANLESSRVEGYRGMDGREVANESSESAPASRDQRVSELAGGMGWCTIRAREPQIDGKNHLTFSGVRADTALNADLEQLRDVGHGHVYMYGLRTRPCRS
jgi:hypothetical protein